MLAGTARRSSGWWTTQGHVAAGKALDILQSAAIEHGTAAISGSTELITAAGADVILLADRSDAGEWETPDALAVLERIRRVAFSPIVVCAGASHAGIVERGVRELGWPRARLVGSAPEALASAVRALVALEARASVRDVALTVLGRPPDRALVPWEDVSIGGLPATRILDGRAMRRLAARLAPLWPPGPRTLAHAAAAAVDALLGRSRRTLSCFVAPDDSTGRRFRAVALPVRLGPTGIVRADIPPLNAHDRIGLDNAMLL